MSEKKTIFEQFLAPISGWFVDWDRVRELKSSIDWESETDRLRQPNLTYPAYYQRQNFHGIEGGYLNASAATSYDPITRYALPPNETWIRESVIHSIRARPRRILDLGCGTGSTTLMLKQAFPDAEVVGLDLSPYMLVMGDRKAREAGVEIAWVHAKAEATGLDDESFDVVAASLLFHETPEAIARAILKESYRLLRVGGEVLILDGHQHTLRDNPWMMDIFEEPYLQEYARGSVDAWMGAAGFGAVQTEQVWGLNQLTRGVKPIAPGEPTATEAEPERTEPTWASAPSY
jgi:ubiquinone/menaquinone biosynthesis C-methylase UbiE